MAGAGVPGLAVAAVTAGGILAWSGVANRSVRDTLKDVMAGRRPGSSGVPTGPDLSSVPVPAGPGTAGGETVSGGEAHGLDRSAGAASGPLGVFMATARAQLGKPYVWATAGPDTFDCSGLVTYCLKRAGLDNQRRVTGQYLVWSGAVTIPRDQCAEGDLVCWTGHIGIAVSRDDMINAPHAGAVVRVQSIWGQPIIRRLKLPTGSPGRVKAV